MSRLFLAVLVWCATAGGFAWGAYAAFDDLQVATPAWMQLQGADAPPLIYRISRQSGQALVELRSTKGTVDMRWCLAGYQRDPSLLSTRIPAGETIPVLVPLSRIDRGLFRLRLTYVIGSGEPKVLLMNAGREAAYGVTVAGVTAAFRAESLGYTISVRDGMADVHVRNFSADTVHCDMRLAGWQDPTQRNPRLHLLPGSTTEVLIPLIRSEGSVAHAVLDVWNIRVGADSGPLLVSQPVHADHLLPEDGWQRIAVFGYAETSAAFNPRVVTWRSDTADPTRLVVRNRSANLISAVARVQLDEQIADLPLMLPAQGETTVVLPFTPSPTQMPFVGLDQVAVDHQAIAPSIPLAVAAVPEQALSVTPRQIDARFNPLTVVYVLERGPAGLARLQLINRCAIAVFADCRIAGYQDPTTLNPRVHLPAGQAVSIELPVTRSDARLALAKVLVWNVRLGADSGETLVATQ